MVKTKSKNISLAEVKKNKLQNAIDLIDSSASERDDSSDD